MEKQIHRWPRLIGGPLHGQPIPDVADQSLIGYVPEDSPGGMIRFYHEFKYRFGDRLAMRVLVYEGDISERVGEFMEDVAIHALATVGIAVKKEDDAPRI